MARSTLQEVIAVERRETKGSGGRTQRSAIFRHITISH